MEKAHEQFIKARDCLESILIDIISELNIAIFDPWIKYIFEQDIKKLVYARFKEDYPETKVNFEFSVYLTAQTIEYSVQRFFHPFTHHKFLGTIRDPERERILKLKEPCMVDCYYNSMYEAFDEPRVIVRFGHNKKDVIDGGRRAANEFFSGLNTSLATAFQLAIEAGYIQGIG